MSALELERAIRELPPEEAQAVARRLQDLLPERKRTGPRMSIDELAAKYRVTEGWAAGLTTDEYLRIVRGGDRD